VDLFLQVGGCSEPPWVQACKMAKWHVLVDTELKIPTPKRIDTGGINWNFCILCQKDGTGLQIQCPYAVKNKKIAVGSGYASLAEQLINFNELGHMQIEVDIKQLDDGSGIEATLAKHHVGWHKSCQ